MLILSISLISPTVRDLVSVVTSLGEIKKTETKMPVFPSEERVEGIILVSVFSFIFWNRTVRAEYTSNASHVQDINPEKDSQEYSSWNQVFFAVRTIFFTASLEKKRTE